MHDDLINFIFQWIHHMVVVGRMELPDAIKAVIREANVMINKHNATRGNYPSFGPEGYLGDNQCIFGSMLLDNVQYKSIRTDLFE